MVTKGGPHSRPPEGHPVVTKGVDPTNTYLEVNFLFLDLIGYQNQCILQLVKDYHHILNNDL